MRPGFDPWVGTIPLVQGMATQSSILDWRIQGTGGGWWAVQSMGSKELDTIEATEHVCMWLSDEESTCQCRRCEFDPWIQKIPWRRK